jgi:carboxymethylenebutenolidase
MISQDIAISVGGSRMPAYLCRPEEGSGPHPAVIVLQEVFGFTPETHRITALLPAIGYVGLAVNYYHRTNPEMSEPYTEEGSKRAFEIARSVTEQHLLEDVGAAAEWLRAQPFVRAGEIATWGFGFGAAAALATASMDSLRGAIAFYPVGATTAMPGDGKSLISDLSKVRIPVLLIFGEKDYYVSRYDMDTIHRALQAGGRGVRTQIYPNVGHSFFRHGRAQAIAELQRYSDESVAQAVADSWNLVRKFLDDVFTGSTHVGETDGIRTPRRQSTPA